MSERPYVDPDVNREYVIVEFPEEIDDGSIPMAIVSSTWIFDKDQNLFCFWPVYIKSPSKREKAIVNHLSLDKEKCTECLIRVKYSSENYEKVSLKLKSLEQGQESQVESDFDAARKPKSNKTNVYTYSSGSDGSVEEYVPKPPKLKLDREPNLKTRVKTPVLTLSTRQETLREPLVKKIWHQEIRTDKPTQRHLSIQEEASNQSPTTTLSNWSSACIQCKNNEGMLRELITSMEKLKLDIKYLIHLNQEKEQEATGDFNITCIYTMEEMIEFDEKLRDEELFRHTCIKLGLIGGKDAASTTRKILSQLISHEMSLKLNWTGRNQKNGLKEFGNVLKLIIGAVRRNPNSKNATIEEVESAVKSWLRNAGDRAGGRCQRKVKKTLSETNMED